VWYCTLHEAAGHISRAQGWPFHKLHGTYKSVFRQLQEKGVRANPKETPRKKKPWGILGTSTPLMLQRAVLYSVGNVSACEVAKNSTN